MNTAFTGVRKENRGDGRPPYKAVFAIHGLTRDHEIGSFRDLELAARAVDESKWWMQDFIRQGLKGLNFPSAVDVALLKKSKIPDAIETLREAFVKAGVPNPYNHRTGFRPPEGSVGMFKETPTPVLPSPDKREKSPYIGVTYRANRPEGDDRRWEVKFAVGSGEVCEVGFYEDEEHAARVSDNARWYLRAFHLTAPVVNFPEPWAQSALPEVEAILDELLEDESRTLYTHNKEDLVLGDIEPAT